MIEHIQDATVHRQSLASEVAQTLSRLIQEGKLAPGARLLETELANSLGISRGPLREALRILEADALIENIPGRGSYVAPVSRRDAEEIYGLRNLLEQEAVRLACLQINEEQIFRLQEVLTRLLEAEQSQDFALAADIDMEFHQTIWEIADNKRLKQILDGMVPVIRRYLSLQTHLFESVIVGIKDHQDIFNAISEKNADAGVVLMKRHLTQAANASVKNLSV